MPERIRATSAPTSHLTQPDEALRQIRAGGLHNLIGAIAFSLADLFTADEPTAHLVAPTLERIATTYVSERTRNTAYADEALQALFRLLPSPRPMETRGEYALRIRVIVGRTHV